MSFISNSLRTKKDRWNNLAEQIHNTNVEKGFWDEGIEARNFGELIALVHSELTEAYVVGDLPDDKLPNLPGLGVEIADAIIRLLDACNAYNIDIDTSLLFHTNCRVYPFTSIEVDLMKVHVELSDALEAHRKTNLSPPAIKAPDDKWQHHLVRALSQLMSFGKKYRFDTMKVVQAKAAYNTTRPHKHGKAY